MAKIVKARPSTPTEELLNELARTSFLSLWSYPSPHRDQKGPKELCDLLVVFGNSVIIFSDKSCTLPEADSPRVAWERWYKKSVTKSVNQIEGAVRWIRNHPDRIFVDESCKQRFPIAIDGANAEIFRIAVVHEIDDFCETHTGSKGLRISTNFDAPPPLGCVGNPSKDGFTHVLSTESVVNLLNCQDTVLDVIDYLREKERFLTSHQVAFDCEEDVLATFLSTTTDELSHKITSNIVTWRELTTSERYRRRVEADQISYLWDRLIETFAHHALNGTQYNPSSGRFAYPISPFSNSEIILRQMASVPRLQRRALAEAVIELGTVFTPIGSRRVRYMLDEPSHTNEFILLCMPQIPGQTYEDWRVARAELLHATCLVLRLNHPSLTDIVAIAFEPFGSRGGAEDALYFNARGWDHEMEKDAQEYARELRIFDHPRMFRRHYREYPMPTDQKVGRNASCPCGSGKKFKKCCLKLRRPD